MAKSDGSRVATDPLGPPEPSAADVPIVDVLIVGAGLSGLAAAYALKQRGIAARIVDAGAAVGDTWRARHPGLHLNTHRWTSYLPGYKLSRYLPGFPSRADFIHYLEDYAEALALPLTFGVEAETLNRDGQSWRLEAGEGDMTARCVIIATGPQRKPRFPEWPGREQLRAEIIHAGEFGDALDYAGRKVLIIGAGNSGVDVANHLSRVETEKVWMSVRGGANVVPLRILSLPTQASSPAIERLPVPLQDAIVRLAAATLGNLGKHGLPRDRMGAVRRFSTDGTAPAIDDGFTGALKQGRIEMVPEVERCGANGLSLKDGRVLEPDVVICATGYRAALEPLVGHLGVLDEDGKPRFVAEETSAEHPGLWFFGLNDSFYGNIRQRRLEAPRLAQAVERYLASQG